MKKILIFLTGLIAAIFIWINITSLPYDTEIPYSIQNKTSIELQINYYFIDVFSEKDIKFKKTHFRFETWR